MTDNEQQRLQKIQEKISQLKTREQAILAKDKNRRRKERTRRLIQNGALAEKYLHCEDMESQTFEGVLKKLVSIDGVEKFYNLESAFVIII